MTRTCVVNLSTGLVENIIKLGGDIPPNCQENAAAPTGYIYIAHDTAAIGWALVNGVLTAPPPPAVDPATAAENQRKIDIDATIAGDATIQLLKGMTNAEFAAWWTANITTNAARDNVLMRLTRLAIRRLA